MTARGAVVALVAGLTMGVCWLTPVPKSGDAAGVVMELPTLVSGMIGVDTPVSEAERLILPPDTEFARKIYRSAVGDEILFSIVLSGAEKRSIHRPEACLPGQGWTIRSGRVEEIPLEGGGMLPVMNLALQRQVQIQDGRIIPLRSFYFYWFVGNGTVTPYHWRRVLLTSWDRIFEGKTHRWAYVIVTAMVTEGLKPMGRSEEETLKMLRDFTGKMAPQVMRTLPK
jgi:hypothetical protein